MEIVGILYNLRSVYNTASCFRTAEGAGVKKLYLVGTTSGPLDRFGEKRADFVKVALGAEEGVGWERREDIFSLLEELANRGFLTVAVEQDEKAENLFKWSRQNENRKLALVFGEETKGLPREVLEKTAKVVEIPMRGKKESLNVSVAFGVAVYTLAEEW